MKRVNTSELKILIVFLYYVIFSVISLIAFTIGSQNIPEFVSELTFYFACESQGVQPGRMCERGFNRMDDTVPVIVVYILLGCVPIVSLVYVFNYKDIKKSFSKWFARKGNGNGR